KTFAASSSDTSITVTYTMINTSGDAQSYAPWEDSRVPVGGLSFFPLGEGGISGDNGLVSAFSNLNDDVMWYEYSSSNDGSKVFADGRNGWRAHVNNGILFLKQFEEDLAPANAAPGEAELEEYVSVGFQEIENQGAYVSIPPGDSISYTVKWFGREVPAMITVEKGSEALLHLARRVAGLETPNTAVEQDLDKGYSAVTVYPNPVSKTLFIRNAGENASFRLMDMTGRVVISRSITRNAEIDLEDCPAGIYNVMILMSGESQYLKIIKIQQ
ncbi:MAG TPA: T9SS type A sorting domain-containing protein, partial [Bacteroidales bacterium]|nr:T9SS type A sorting domain-containing protein [Bacteroidales bacterium]